MNVHIVDNLFAHAPSSSWYNTPKKFKWNRSVSKNLTILTDDDLYKIDDIDSQVKIGWLVESKLIKPGSYEFIKNNIDKFQKIFTHDYELLNLSEKFEFLHVGGCWIEHTDRKIHKKNKLVSIITSEKYGSEGYDLRHRVVDSISCVDVFGRGYNEIPNKIVGLKDYKYSIVIENCKYNYYFTEKLIDCFITGTVPIYWGCPDIGVFFDKKGILTFETIDELNSIIENLGDFYEENKISILKNFYISMRYLIADDILYESLKNNKLI